MRTLSLKQSSGRQEFFQARRLPTFGERYRALCLGESSEDRDLKVFVYGSLLSGEDHHHRLSRSPALGSCRTEPTYTLVDLGAYPGLLEGGMTSVHGEVYEVDAS